VILAVGALVVDFGRLGQGHIPVNQVVVKEPKQACQKAFGPEEGAGVVPVSGCTLPEYPSPRGHAPAEGTPVTGDAVIMSDVEGRNHGFVSGQVLPYTQCFCHTNPKVGTDIYNGSVL
jgi:hypothetical protein